MTLQEVSIKTTGQRVTIGSAVEKGDECLGHQLSVDVGTDFSTFYCTTERTYASLTPSQYVFLILQDDLHYDDDTIAKVLGVKLASLRTLRSRIKGRER